MHSLLDPDGDVAWEGERLDVSACMERLGRHPCAGAFARLAGSSEKLVTRGAVLAEAERLGFLERQGSPQGYLTLLPKATQLEHAVQAHNREHVRALGAALIDFPLVFDQRVPGMSELIQSYERRGLTYRLGAPDPDLRLAYAADPGLFSWLRSRTLDPARLPYAIHSLTPIFRRALSGFVGGIDRLRQYTVPDLHVLCDPAGSDLAYLDCVRSAAVSARWWLGEEFVQFLNAVPGLLDRYPRIGRDAARAARQYTLLRTIERRSSYYLAKGGLVVDAAFDGIMLFNFQLDDTNGRRFDIHIAGGGHPDVIHATLAGGWPKLLPIVLGRGLSGVGPRHLPIELSRPQVACVPLAERHLPLAHDFCGRARQQGLSVSVDEAFELSLGARVHRQRSAWCPAQVVIGDRAADCSELRIESWQELPDSGACNRRQPGQWSLQGLCEAFGDGLRRCNTGAVARWDLPFAQA